MFILIYGEDGTGKSTQCLDLANTEPESAIYWSFAVKNRRLAKIYPDITSDELVSLVTKPSGKLKMFDTDPYKTIDTFHAKVAEIVTTEPAPKFLIIDDVSQLREWATPCVIEAVNKTRKNRISTINKDDLDAWSKVNAYTYDYLETLANWAEANNVLILAIGRMKDLYVDNEYRGSTPAVKRNLMYLADVRIKLERSNGKYQAVFDKVQKGMGVSGDKVALDESGLVAELMVRGIIE